MEKKEKNTKYNRAMFLVVTTAVIVILSGLLICSQFYINKIIREQKENNIQVVENENTGQINEKRE